MKILEAHSGLRMYRSCPWPQHQGMTGEKQPILTRWLSITDDNLQWPCDTCSCRPLVCHLMIEWENNNFMGIM